MAGKGEIEAAKRISRPLFPAIQISQSGDPIRSQQNEKRKLLKALRSELQLCETSEDRIAFKKKIDTILEAARPALDIPRFTTPRKLDKSLFQADDETVQSLLQMGNLDRLFIFDE